MGREKRWVCDGAGKRVGWGGVCVYAATAATTAVLAATVAAAMVDSTTVDAECVVCGRER